MVDRHRFYPAPATFASRRSRIVSSDHHTHSHAREIVAADQKRLKIVLAAVTIYCATEFVGGYFSNSLALMTDAVHMLTDIAALGLGLLTLWISTRPATGGKTFGYLRAEILGALLNGLFLWLLVVFIWIEAARRLRHPQEVKGLGVMAVAIVGIVVNGFAAWLTGEHQESGMAIRSVFVHVLSDLIGSFGVLAAGALVYFTGWAEADPVV